MLNLSRACSSLVRRGSMRTMSSIWGPWGHAFSNAETGLKIALPQLLVQAREERTSFLLESLQPMLHATDLSFCQEQEVQSPAPMLCRGKKRWRKQGRKVMGIVSTKSRRRVANRGCLH
mmetsp:Transcript_13087/g.15795  ORF Transcript_13087/g.15795 Transcript_13087/m.15795 type:complete len:119 (+) Transcript_13087:102-458(+)